MAVLGFWSWLAVNRSLVACSLLARCYLPTLGDTGEVSFLFAFSSLSLHPPTLRGKKVIINFLFTVPHTYMDNVLLPSQRLVFGCSWQIFWFTYCQVLKFPAHTLCVVYRNLDAFL